MANSYLLESNVAWFFLSFINLYLIHLTSLKQTYIFYLSDDADFLSIWVLN